MRRTAPGQAVMQHERHLDYDSPDVPKVRPFVAAAAGLVGLVYAAVIAGLAVAMSGAGHGWNSASISFSGLVLIPIAAIALVYRRRTPGFALAVGMLMAGLSADVWLVIAAQDEGMRYVQRAWTALPGIAIAWFAM